MCNFAKRCPIRDIEVGLLIERNPTRLVKARVAVHSIISALLTGHPGDGRECE
jgi:hypothetical protein